MYKYIHTCIHIHIYLSAHIHTYTYIHTHIQNVRINARKHAWNDVAAANAWGAVVERGSFVRLFRSTQSNHTEHLQCKDFIVPTCWNTNTFPAPIPSSQYTSEQFADCRQAQLYCSTLIRWTERIVLKKLRAASQWSGPCVVVERLEGKQRCSRAAVLAAGKIGDSPIKSDMKLGLQTHLGAEFQS